MSKRYSGKSFKDSSVMKKPKLSMKEKRKIKKEKKKNKNWKRNLAKSPQLQYQGQIWIKSSEMLDYVRAFCRTIIILLYTENIGFWKLLRRYARRKF